MTHEATPGAEAPDGPEHDHHLPDAMSVPVADGPDDLPPVDHPDVAEHELVTGLNTPGGAV